MLFQRPRSPLNPALNDLLGGGAKFAKVRPHRVRSPGAARCPILGGKSSLDLSGRAEFRRWARKFLERGRDCETENIIVNRAYDPWPNAEANLAAKAFVLMTT